MRRGQRINYLLLGMTGSALGAGLLGRALSLEDLSLVSFAAGAAVGLGLSISLLIAAIRHRQLGSDILALISILATVATNELLAASVIALMLAGGRALESWAEGRARNQLSALLARAPHSAHRVDLGDVITDIELAQICIGDRILVRSGEVVPIDGSLVLGGTFDESALTGEPMPQYRSIGESVNSGVLNAGSAVELIATGTTESSTYSNLIRLVSQAQANSATGVRVANKWAARFVPFALGLALIAWIVSGEVSNAVAVIVAATPCPLILAVPVAIISGMSRASARGAIVKGGAALEGLARAKTVLLDKTGTLTMGGPQITALDVKPGVNLEETLRVAASLEQSSPHIVALAIVAEANRRGLTLVRATNVIEVHGSGLTGEVEGQRVYAGQLKGKVPAWVKSDHSLMVAIEIDEALVAILGLNDPIRIDAGATIENLRTLGIERIAMVSGDRQSTADEISRQVGLDEVFAHCTPEEKLRVVRAEMAATDGTVIAVGDGINDAPALAAAHVGVAMGARGATAASEAADVVIIEDSLSHLSDAIDIAQGARIRALQAAGIGMTLASAAMLMGAFGIFNATASAVAQEFIDAAAILWALVPAKSQIRK